MKLLFPKTSNYTLKNVVCLKRLMKNMIQTHFINMCCVLKHACFCEGIKRFMVA